MRLNRIRSLLLLAMVVLSANSLSLTVIKKDFNELVDESDGVVHGTVSDIQTGIEQGDIYTWVTINNIDVIQGDFYEKTLTLRFCGGSYKSYNVSCGGVPQFDVGEEVVWFVKGNGSYSIPLSGGPQGVIYVGKTELKNSVGQSIKALANDQFLMARNSARSSKDVPMDRYVDEAGVHNVILPSLLSSLKEKHSDQRLSISELKFKIASRTLPSRKLKSQKIPELLTAKRYSKLKHLKKEQDFEDEFLKNGSRKQRQSRLREYFLWKGLSTDGFDAVINAFPLSYSATRLLDDRETVQNLFDALAIEHENHVDINSMLTIKYQDVMHPPAFVNIYEQAEKQ
ncbi:MAG: hypothetical protein ACI9GZ_004439 [Bacteroidia bacterium]|jgi:hypothetical protein